MKRINSFVLICILINLFGCHYGKSVSSSEKVEKTCLVLSVGSSKGIAQIGAIDAIKDSGVQIDYVFGNSIGSAIGGIYAFDPSRNLKQTIKKIFKDYKMATKKDKEESATTGFLVGVGLMFLSGGAFGWETVLGSTILGSESEQLVDNDRFKRVLDKHFKKTGIEDMPIPFATSYKVKKNSGLELQIANNGNIADAIAKSCNNKYIFKNTTLKYVDPGVDRIGIVPIDDAYNTFHPTRIIAINVSDSPAIYSSDLSCDVIEISVQVRELELGVSNVELNEQIEALYLAGYTATQKVLDEIF
jgi:NTE family protein